MIRAIVARIFSIVGQVIRDFRIELDLSLLDELHRQRRRELLRDRAEAKLRIGRIRNIPLHIRLPVRTFVNNLPILRDEGRAIELPVLVRERQHFLDLRRMVLGDGDVWGDKKNDCDTQSQSVS